jgi:hypothetical protein
MSDTHDEPKQRVLPEQPTEFETTVVDSLGHAKKIKGKIISGRVIASPHFDILA